MNTTTPNTQPINLSSFYNERFSKDENAQRVHAALASLSLQQIQGLMPKPQRVEIGDDAAQYALFGTPEVPSGLPVANFDQPESIAITGGQFGQDYDAGKWLMTEAIRAISTPDMPLLYFPSPRIGHRKNLILSPRSMDRIRTGDLGPIIDLRLKAVEKLLDTTGHPKSAFSFGHSQEAFVATAMAERLTDHVENSVLHASDDPGLVQERTAKELKADFTGDNPIQTTRNLYDAVRSSGVPALVDAQGITHRFGEGILSTRWGMVRDLGGLGLSQGMKVNKSLHESMASGSSLGTLSSFVAKGGKATETRAEQSLILDDDSLAAATALIGVARNVVSGYGHEYYDNIILAALVNKRALELAA